MIYNCLKCLIFYITGSVVDVGKLLGQLKRSEKARSDTESQLKSAHKTVQDLKEASEKHSSVKDRLQVSKRHVLIIRFLQTLKSCKLVFLIPIHIPI